jgi:hypothetical protein
LPKGRKQINLLFFIALIPTFNLVSLLHYECNLSLGSAASACKGTFGDGNLSQLDTATMHIVLLSSFDVTIFSRVCPVSFFVSKNLKLIA